MWAPVIYICRMELTRKLEGTTEVVEKAILKKRILAPELKKMRRFYSAFGRQKDCKIKKGVDPRTIRNILKKGIGWEDNVNGIIEYYQEYSQTKV
jgi:hypothetical protein